MAGSGAAAAAEAEEVSPLRALSCKELTFMLCMCLNMTAMSMNFAMMASFFPIYAAEVGLTVNQVATIFIAYSLTKMFVSPLAGALASRIGRKPVLVIGVVTISLTTMFFGLVPELVGGEVMPMFYLMNAIRMLQGVGMVRFLN